MRDCLSLRYRCHSTHRLTLLLGVLQLTLTPADPASGPLAGHISLWVGRAPTAATVAPGLQPSCSTNDAIADCDFVEKLGQETDIEQRDLKRDVNLAAHQLAVRQAAVARFVACRSDKQKQKKSLIRDQSDGMFEAALRQYLPPDALHVLNATQETRDELVFTEFRRLVQQTSSFEKAQVLHRLAGDDRLSYGATALPSGVPAVTLSAKDPVWARNYTVPVSEGHSVVAPTAPRRHATAWDDYRTATVAAAAAEPAAVTSPFYNGSLSNRSRSSLWGRRSGLGPDYTGKHTHRHAIPHDPSNIAPG